MIKRKPLAAGTAELPDTLDGFIESPTSSIVRSITSKENSLRDFERYTENNQNRIAELQRETEQYAVNIGVCSRDIANLESQLGEVDTSTHDALVKKQLALLALNPYIDKIRVSNNCLVVTTKPLFTPIRVKDGAKKHVRRCIGAFEIDVPSRPGDSIHARNLVWDTYGYPHWSINTERKMCQGEWAAVIDSLRESKDAAGLVNTLLDYLRSTLDSGAYVRAHNWLVSSRQEWRDALSGANNFNVGDTVIVYAGNNFRNGTRGIVSALTTSSGQQHVRLSGRKSPEGSEVSDSSTWEASSRMLPISKLVYRRVLWAGNLNDLAQKHTTTRSKKSAAIELLIDNAPDGITIDELLAIKNS